MKGAMRTPTAAPARRLLDRLRELGRRLGGAVEQSLRQPDVGQVPVPVPAEERPDDARRPRRGTWEVER